MEPLRPGDSRTIADFRIEGLLGEGGMGRAYLGRSPGGRRGAVKVVRSADTALPHEDIDRMTREAERMPYGFMSHETR